MPVHPKCEALPANDLQAAINEYLDWLSALPCAPIEGGHHSLHEILRHRRVLLPDGSHSATDILLAHTALVTVLYERELLLLRQTTAGAPTDQIEGLVQRQVAAVEQLRREMRG